MLNTSKDCYDITIVFGLKYPLGYSTICVMTTKYRIEY